MNWHEFLITTIENLVASFPQLVVVVTTIIYMYGTIKKQTADFPLAIEDTKKTLTSSFDCVVTDVEKILNNSITKITDNIVNNMDRMEKELKGFNGQMENMKDKYNLLLLENKAFFDIISVLVSSNPEMINKDVTSKVNHFLNLTKKELEVKANQFISNLPVLEKALKDALINFTQQEIDDMLGRLGYEKK